MIDKEVFIMKKSIKIMSVVLVVLMLCLTLASCGKKVPSGTYEAPLGLGSYEFKGSKVTVEILGEEIEGTYKIKDDKISFQFESDDEDMQELLDEMGDEAVSYEKTDDGIKIGGVEYKKK